MELKHTINDVVIDEPSGFDNLKTTIKRGTYFGMSAEVSVGSLEFYGKAYNIINDAYAADIDSKLEYKVVNVSTGEVIYKGSIDLSTCAFTCGDYCSVSASVGEVGAKTTFNNRVDTDVDLTDSKTIDGADLLHAGNWKAFKIPAKPLPLTCKSITKATKLQTKDSANQSLKLAAGTATTDQYLQIALEDSSVAEFGEFANTWVRYETGSDAAFFIRDDEYAESNYNANFCITATIRFTSAASFANGRHSFRVELFALKGNGKGISAKLVKGGGNDSTSKSAVIDNQHKTATFKLYGSLKDVDVRSVNVFFCFHSFISPTFPNHGEYPFEVEIEAGSYANFSMREISEESKAEYEADMIPVHDAINHIAEAISENALSVKSDLYARPSSACNPSATYGASSMKFITNGYHMRGLFTDEENSRKMAITFKKFIESMNAQDCIGWGFSEEGGSMCIRVEHWDWFFKDDVILSVTGANEKKVAFDSSQVITKFNIGYKKYKTSDDYNAINSPHGERTYSANVKALNVEKTALCDFIADNYSIEEARRMRFKKDPNEESSYDEKIFIFETLYDTFPTEGEVIAEDSMDGESILNGSITPMHNAQAWRDRVFCVAGLNELKLTAGTINYNSFVDLHTIYSADLIRNADHAKDIPLIGHEDTGDEPYQTDQRTEDLPLSRRYYSRMINGVIVPNDVTDLLVPRAKFNAEILSFKYPITFDQYLAIKSHPYSLIQVDCVKGWIKEFTYSFADGEAEFKLITKYES